MNGLKLNRFDYGDIPEPEQRAMERHAEKIRVIRQRVARSAVEIGSELKDAHERLSNRGDGTFGQWVESCCGITPRHARNFMAAAEVFGTKEWENLFPLLDDSAMFLLSSSPDTAREEVRRIAASGKVVSHKLAKSIVEKHKPTPQSDLPRDYSPHGKPSGKRSTKSDRVGSAESAAAGQPADERGGVGAAPTACPSLPLEGPVVIDVESRVVAPAESKPEPQEPTDELALRDALLSALAVLTSGISEASRLSNDLIKPDVQKCLREAKRLVSSALEVVSTGEPLDEPEAQSYPAAESDRSENEITGEPSVMVFAIKPRKKGGCTEWGLPQSFLDELAECFSAVDVLTECRNARLWCLNNPSDRKTARGMREFLRKWMERQQNRGGGGGRHPTQRPSRLSVVDEYLAEYGEGDAA